MDNWIIYSIIASILSALAFIILKYFTDNIGFLLLSFVFVGIISLVYLIGFHKTDIKLMLPYAFLYAILFVSMNILICYAVKCSTNISYAHLIINLNIILTIIASYFLFKQQLNMYTFIGIVISLIGVTIVIFNSK
tara:strand:- start:259 stop:666 length:408 start_codon:yes stop_codon:yes gene_type:complete